MVSNIILFANGRVGFEICNYLYSINENIQRIYIIDSDAQYAEKIKNSFVDIDIFHAEQLKNSSHVQELKTLAIDYMITVYWPYLLKPEIFDLSKNGCINFHPALLPTNRGWYPHVHNILYESPAGVTLHLIDEGADTGPILAQKKIDVEPIDTAFTLYEKLQNEIIDLFKKTWLKIKNGEILPKLQDESNSSYHKKREMDDLDYIDLEKTFTGRELINLLRARTFGNKGFAYFRVGEKKIFLNLKLNYTDEF